jgi:hypothetical protein
MEEKSSERLKKRRTVIVGIALMVAALHLFHPGIYVTGQAHGFYFSYFSDFTIPFALYFLLLQTEFQAPIMKLWQAKAAVAFLLPSISETLQYFGIWAAGIVFDPWDYAAYALGVVAAALLDRQVLNRVFVFWSEKEALTATGGDNGLE